MKDKPAGGSEAGKPKSAGKHKTSKPAKKTGKLKKKNGRPPTTVAERLNTVKTDFDKIQALAGFGLSDEEIGSFLGVTERTVNRWKKDKKFLSSLKRGKIKSDAKAIQSLYKRVSGYDHPEDKIFFKKTIITDKEGNKKEFHEPVIIPTTKHYPPETFACVYWLNNRRPADWKQKREEGQEDKNIIIVRPDWLNDDKK